MFTFVEQLGEFLHSGVLHYFLLFFIFVWLKWLIVKYFARQYVPFEKRHSATTSVIIPVVDEPVDLFTEVLRRITRQKPTEIIVIINGPRNKSLEAVCKRYKYVKCVWTKTPGKRNAIRRGMQYAKGDLISTG